MKRLLLIVFFTTVFSSIFLQARAQTNGPAGASIITTGTLQPVNTTYSSASPSSSFNLSGKNFSSNVLVTAPYGFEVSTDNLKFSKTVSIDPEAYNAQLSSINFNPDILRIAGSATAASNYNYAATVDNAVSSIQVTPIAVSAKASIKINGILVASGTTSAPLPLDVGSNKISIVVTAANNITVKTYTVTINRAPSNNADLALIKLSAGTLSPAFSANVINYTSVVNSTIKSITVTPTAAGTGAQITVNGVKVASGTASQNILLNGGVNKIEITVTAQDGSTARTYTVAVTNVASSNAGLSQIGLTPNISFIRNDVNIYTATVLQSTNAVEVVAIKSDINAIVNVNGAVLAAGTNTALVNLNALGPTIINIIVTAQDGVTVQAYKITVNRDSQTNTNISSISLSPHSISYVPGTTNYVSSVAPSVTTVQQSITVINPNATIKVNGIPVASGVPSPPITLNKNGSTIITTVVTAPNGVTTRTYTITIARNGSSNADLSQISLNPTATITRQINAIDYTTSVSPLTNNVQITVVSSHPNSTIKIDGASALRGIPYGPIQLNTSGTTSVKIAITAEDGVTSKIYTLNIARKGSSNAGLANFLSSPGATFTAVPNTSNYTTSVNAATSSFQLGIIPADENATVKVNGTAINDAVLSNAIQLAASGVTTIPVVITAEDGATTQTYNVIVSKNGSTNTALTQLTISPEATLTPVPGTNTYTTSVNSSVTSIQQTAVTDDTGATIKVNGIVTGSGTASKLIPLNPSGTTTVTTVVTAPSSGATKTYAIIVSKKGSSNTGISQISLTPTSTLIKLPGTDNYTTSLSSVINSVQLSLTPADAGATIKVNGQPVAAGAASQLIQLSTNDISVITTEVTAQDGLSKKKYTVTITRGSNSEVLSPQTSDLPSMLVFSRLQANIPAGIYADNVTIASAGATEIAIPTGNCKVNPAPLKITANNAAKSYGDALTDVTASKAFTVTGLKNDEILSTTALNYNKGAAAIDNVGLYQNAVIPAPPFSGTNGFLASNYDITAVSGNLTVTPAALVISAKKVSKVYGSGIGNVLNSTAFTTNGLKNGNIIRYVDISYTNGITPTSTTGTYKNAVVAVNAIGDNGYLGSNYNVTYLKGDLVVLPALLTVTVNDQTREFDNPDPAFTVTYKGFVNNEGSSVILTPPLVTTTAVSKSPIGRYPIIASSAVAENYIFNYLPGMLTVTGGHIVLSVPNVITPNGDGINDTWNIKNLEAYPHVAVTIFDRLGRRVFNSNGYGTAWDGTLNGSTLQPGTYYYIIDPKEPKERARTVTGSITLVR